jgi:hypothetical protein
MTAKCADHNTPPLGGAQIKMLSKRKPGTIGFLFWFWIIEDALILIIPQNLFKKPLTLPQTSPPLPWNNKNS